MNSYVQFHDLQNVGSNKSKQGVFHAVEIGSLLTVSMRKNI